MTITRRYLVLQILMLWQGGFLFYASFVVPTGTDLFGSVGQGSVTARVTEYLNLCGTLGVVLFAWDLIAERDPSRRRNTIRWICWIVAAGSQAALFILHVKLEEMMDPTRTFIVATDRFYGLHGIYLWTSTAQWIACLVLAWFTLRAWTTPKA